MRELNKWGVDTIKLNLSREEITGMPAEANQFSDEEISVAVEEARPGKTPAAHARSKESIQQCVKYGIEYIYHASFSGDGAAQGTPYEGQHPHGAVLQTLDSTVTVNGHTGEVIVKRNYGGEDVSVSKVANDPDAFLGAVTVMFRREQGYDPDNANWFWAKYKPDGSLDTNPKDMKLAGRVAKGADQGCIACHTAAPGGDYVYNNDRF